MKELLSVQGISKQYPGFRLENVSFSLQPGRIMGLIGKNGAGKSTTLKAIMNMVRPDSGTVRLLGEELSEKERQLKERIGVVFGGIDFYPLKRLSAITAITRRFYRGWDQERYQGYLKRFELDEHKSFRSLSNGMKVKYLLALALSHQAELLILDEPTSGLDPVSRDELLHIFSRIVADGRRSILFSTHITSDLERCADDITYLVRGRVRMTADKTSFLSAFESLKAPGEQGRLTLEEIMLRTEREAFDEAAL